MIKKYGLWYAIKYYNLIEFFLAVILLILFKEQLALYLLSLSGITAYENPTIYELSFKLLPLLFLSIWAWIFFSHCRNQSYRYQTGRNYSYDAGHYKRSYRWLIDYFQDAEPHKLDTSSFPEQTWRETKGLIFGMDRKKIISIPSASECNIAIFGPPGSGKTSGIAIINAMQFEGSVLAVDIKGDIYNYVHKNSDRKIIRFAPDAPDALQISCHFDPLAGFKTMSKTDQKLYLENMATILIPDEGGNDGNYFATRARKLFQGISHLILHENPDASFPTIIHAILKGNVFDWVTQSIESDCETSKELLASFYGNNEKNVSGAYDALTTALIHFSNPILDELLTGGKNCVSIDSLEQGYDVYLQIAQEHLDAYAPIFTLLIQSFSTGFTKRFDSSTGIKNRPILMLLDEFPQLTFSYKMINSNLSTLRSKSVICMIIQQNLSQLQHRYQPTGTQSIIGNCNYQIILGSNDINSSKTFSETFGMKKVLKISNNITHSSQASSGRSVQEAEIRVFPPEYFGDLSAQSKMIIYFKGKYAVISKINCYQL